MPNIHEPDFEPSEEKGGFHTLRARLGRQAGAERLGASVYEIPPGQSPWPYHFHLANEELLVVMRGRPHLRDPGGWRQLETGEVVSFPVGEAGAHQVHNRTDEPVRVLIVSEMNAPEVAVYPDSRKLAAFERAPGKAGAGRRLVFGEDSEVDYWDGEKPPLG